MVWLTILLAGCGEDSGARSSGQDGGGPLAGEVTVLAAASLVDAFTALGETFEAAHPQTTVRFSFGASSSLREQMLAGAPGDVYASADADNMRALAMAGLVRTSAVIATNELAIAVPAGNPGGVASLHDLARPDLLVGLCAEAVPCGRLARRALASAGVEAAVDTNALDARSLLAKVASGDLDAGVVYRTDVAAGGEAIGGVDIGLAPAPVAEYHVAVVVGSSNRRLAAAFVALARSEQGERVLTSHGFGVP